MNRFIDKIMVFVNPRYWIVNYTVDKEYDRQLNEFLDSNPKIICSDEYKTEFENVTLWTANYPYAYGYICNLKFYRNKTLLPKRSTVRRLKRYIKTNWGDCKLKVIYFKEVA